MTTTLTRSKSLAVTRETILGLAAPLALAWGLPAGGALAEEAPVEIPAPVLDATHEDGTATAVFAGGCFGGCRACSST